MKSWTDRNKHWRADALGQHKDVESPQNTSKLHHIVYA